MYEHAASLDPRDADALTGWAGVLRSFRSYKEALRLLRRAIRAEPWNDWALRSFGLVLNDLNRTEVARHWFSWAHRRFPESVTILLEWAKVFGRQARHAKVEEVRQQLYAKAAEKLQLAVEVDPWNTSPWCVWGRLLLDLQRPREALEKFDGALRLDPNNLDAKEGLAAAEKDLAKLS
jgi:tetratricopeptide (TPR) repeat protein